MRRSLTILTTLLLLACVAMPTSAANIRYSAQARSIISGNVHAFWVCDTEAGLPTSPSDPIAEGDLAYAKDTNALKYWDGSAWQDVSSGGPGGGLDHDDVMDRIAFGGF